MRVDAIYQASEKDALIGGDWYDAIELPDGRFVLSIGDVTGHGLEASIVAARLRYAILDFAANRESPADVLNAANSVLLLEHPGTYASALVAYLDPTLSTLHYASAGHVPPMIATTQDAPATVLPTDGTLLGIERKLPISSYDVDIVTGSVVCFYTDGMVEFSRSIDEAERRLACALSQMVGDVTTGNLAVQLRDLVLEGATTVDDAAILVLQVDEIANPGASVVQPELVKRWRFHSSDAYSAHIARQELMKFVASHTQNIDDLFATELIIGELLANTVEHAPGVVEVEIDWAHDRPVIAVVDSGPGLKGIDSGLPLNALNENGRGLFLVKQFAHDLRISRAPGHGTRLEAELLLHSPRSFAFSFEI